MGLNIAGPVRPSNVWPPEPDPAKHTPRTSISLVMSRAWEYRDKIRSMPANECSQTILKDTIEEIEIEGGESNKHVFRFDT